MRALLIQHKGAGKGGTSGKALAAAMRQADWKVRILPRKKVDEEAITDAKPDLVVIAGGDGTVSRVLKLLPDRSVPVAIIPTGTANNIALSLGIEGDAESIIAGWDPERRQRLDFGNAHGPWGCRPFAEAVGFGAFADSLRRAHDLDGAEKLQVGRRAFTDALRHAAPVPLEVRVDGMALPKNLLFVEVMNVPYTGPQLRLAPGAEPGDGKLHVSYLPAGRREAMLRWLDAGKGAPPVEQASGREVTAQGGGVTLRIDDESCGLEPQSEVTIRLEGEPVQLLAPPRRPALAG